MRTVALHSRLSLRVNTADCITALCTSTYTSRCIHMKVKGMPRLTAHRFSLFGFTRSIFTHVAMKPMPEYTTTFVITSTSKWTTRTCLTFIRSAFELDASAASLFCESPDACRLGCCFSVDRFGLREAVPIIWRYSDCLCEPEELFADSSVGDGEGERDDAEEGVTGVGGKSNPCEYLLVISIDGDPRSARFKTDGIACKGFEISIC